MKATLLTFATACSVAVVALAQTDPQSPDALSPAPGSDYSPLEWGAHHTVWGRVVWEQAPSGELVPHTNSYVDLARGLNVLRNGAWVRASELIEGFPGGAVARQGQHSVIFANNLATD